MKKIIVLILFCVSTQTINAHPDGYVPNDSLYRASFQQIKEMLEGKRMLNFKEAVFITENAYLNGAIDREFFEMNIQILALLAQEIARQEHLKYQYEDSINIRKNWGITRVLTDSFYLKMYGHNVEWRPTSYNFEDPLGEKDWTNTFVSNLIWTSKGNCHSLPFLYKILAEELGAEAFLSLAPSHLYLQIPCKNREIGSYNLELTSKSHPTTGLIVANSYISLEAIQAGLYMNKLSLKESIALTLLDLAQGYQKKFPKASEDFILECIKTVLEHFPNCVNAQLLKVEILAKKYQRTKDVLTFAELNQTCNWLISNGYDEMPKEMYAEGLTSSNPYEHLSPKYQTANKEGLNPYFDAKTATVGNGKYLETHITATLEYIGSVIYNTQTKQVETIQDYQQIGDLTMNPSLVGRFLSVDPISKDYPMLTPYQFASNSPIAGIDLDGLEFFFTPNGEFLGKYGTSQEMRIVNAGAISLGYGTLADAITLKGYIAGINANSIPFDDALPATKDAVYMTIYKMEGLGENSGYKLKDIEYIDPPNYYSKRHKYTTGSEKGKFLGGQAAEGFAHYYEETNEGIIVVNGGSSNYYDMAQLLRHENNHNKESARGVESGEGHPYEHFLVEKDAFNKYKDKISERAINHSIFLFKSYIDEHVTLMNQIEDKTTPEYGKMYEQYKEMDRFIKTYDKSEEK